MVIIVSKIFWNIFLDVVLYRTCQKATSSSKASAKFLASSSAMTEATAAVQWEIVLYLLSYIIGTAINLFGVGQH